MRAFIKDSRWDQFQEISDRYGFYIDLKKPNKYLTKIIDDDMILLVQKKTREMHLLTPMGESPFMEVHKQFYQDLFDDGYVEFVESRFD